MTSEGPRRIFIEAVGEPTSDVIARQRSVLGGDGHDRLAPSDGARGLAPRLPGSLSDPSGQGAADPFVTA